MHLLKSVDNRKPDTFVDEKKFAPKTLDKGEGTVVVPVEPSTNWSGIRLYYYLKRRNG